MRIPFPFIAYTHDDLCRKIRDYNIQSFGKGCRIIRRAEFLEEIRYQHNLSCSKNKYTNFNLQEGGLHLIIVSLTTRSRSHQAEMILLLSPFELTALLLNKMRPFS